MTIATVNSRFDYQTREIVPNDTATWADITEWNSWTQWVSQPADPMVWITDPIDLGEVKTFAVGVECDAIGQVSYEIYTSDTGAFEGEESTLVVNAGDSNVGAVTGQYFCIAVKVAKTSQAPVIFAVNYTVSEKTNQLLVNNLDTSTLTGTASLRTYTPTISTGSVKHIQITPHAVTSYAVDLYVSNTPTSDTVIPRIINKSPIQFALVGVDNQPRDAVVDMVIEYLPKGQMVGNNLVLS